MHKFHLACGVTGTGIVVLRKEGKKLKWAHICVQKPYWWLQEEMLCADLNVEKLHMCHFSTSILVVWNGKCNVALETVMKVWESLFYSQFYSADIPDKTLTKRFRAKPTNYTLLFFYFIPTFKPIALHHMHICCASVKHACWRLQWLMRLWWVWLKSHYSDIQIQMLVLWLPTALAMDGAVVH